MRLNEKDGRFDLNKFRKRGDDHLIKKVKIRTRAIPQGKDSEGNEKPPIIETTNELQMYSRLDALRQLRENFGMKQEQRTNTLEETRRQEVEREIKEIMVADNCDQSTAAQSLLDNIGNAPPLVPIIRRYIHCARPVCLAETSLELLEVLEHELSLRDQLPCRAVFNWTPPPFFCKIGKFLTISDLARLGGCLASVGARRREAQTKVEPLSFYLNMLRRSLVRG